MPDPIRFLLVEDNEDHAMLVKRAFQRHRLANEIDHVQTGEAAIEFVEQRVTRAEGPRPDVILLDLNLPGLSGIDVLKRLKDSHATRSIPIVVLTTSNTERDRALAYEHHVSSFVTKPIDFARLQDIVEQLSLYWTICNQPPP